MKDTPNSIVVLPFANMSRDEDAEYLSDGLAEELLNVLSKIDGLRVAGRTSSFSFKGKQTSFEEIGRLLNVESVLEGSVRTAGKRVRISVQLVNIADGFHVWSETYDRTLDDIFEIQDDIAQSVVGELRSRLIDRSVTPDLSRAVAAEVANAAKGRTQNPEAQRLILLGKHLVERRTKADVASAVEYLKQALELDRENAMGWVALGNAHYIAGGNAWTEQALAHSEARSAVDNALRIDPDLAVGYALLAKIQAAYDGDFKGAEASVQRAAELGPDDPFVVGSVGFVAMILGQIDRSLRFLRRALLMDPLNAMLLANVGYVAHAAGFLDEAETVHRRSLEITPNRGCIRAHLSLVILDRGRTDEALREALAEPDEAWRLWSVAIVENASGRQDHARRALADLVKAYAEDSALQIAEVYARLGEVDDAFKWLDVAIAQRDTGLPETKWSVNLRPLHSDPRWLDLLKKIGFPDEGM